MVAYWNLLELALVAYVRYAIIVTANAPSSTSKQGVERRNTGTMASGFGLRGGIGRCYPFFADYKECLVRFM